MASRPPPAPPAEDAIATTGLFAGLHVNPSASKDEDDSSAAAAAIENKAKPAAAAAAAAAAPSKPDEATEESVGIGTTDGVSGHRHGSGGEGNATKEVDDTTPPAEAEAAAEATAGANSSGGDTEAMKEEEGGGEKSPPGDATSPAAAPVAASAPDEEADAPETVPLPSPPPPRPSAANERDTSSGSFHVVTEDEVEEAKKQQPPPSSSSPRSSPSGRHQNRNTRSTSQHHHHAGAAAGGSAVRTTVSSKPRPIHRRTPVPNSDSCLRLLRKLVTKTGPSMPESAGGTMKVGWMSYLFGLGGGAGGGGGGAAAAAAAGGTGGCALDDPSLEAYRLLVESLDIDSSGGGGGGDGDVPPPPPSPAAPPSPSLDSAPGESDLIVESILGPPNATSAKSRRALSAFVHLCSVWCHESEFTVRDRMADRADGSSGGGGGVVTPELLGLVVDTAQGLVAHGCLDGVLIESEEGTTATTTAAAAADDEMDAGDGSDDDADGDGRRGYIKAVNVLAESVFVADLSSERTELSALKFLLTTGCRTAAASSGGGGASSSSSASEGQPGEAMLRGSYLLQTIRTCYHVYLKTASEPNKTTARAALRQLVASVFTRMERRNEAMAVAAAAASAASPGGKGAPATPAKKKGVLEATIPEEEAEAEGAGAEEEEKKKESCKPVASPLNRSASATSATAAGGGGGDFPSPDHRDAFLVLRSLCKLSMRSLPDGTTAGAGAHWEGTGATGGGGGGGADGAAGIGGGGRADLDGAAMSSAAADSHEPAAEHAAAAAAALADHHHLPAALSTTTANGINPAFESKILALDLLLYVLQPPSTAHNNHDPTSLLSSGPQFVYAVRNYLCVSLLKNCTSDNTTVVNLSLRLFVPLIRHFRSHLKTEIEAFVTNVFFVILDSENSTIEHKSLVVTLFQEICSDPTTLADIFLNYDCDLSAVDLFQRIVNTLAKVAKVGLTPDLKELGGTAGSSMMFVAGAGAVRAERLRQDHRELRLDAMKSVRQVLQSLHASIVSPVSVRQQQQQQQRQSTTSTGGVVAGDGGTEAGDDARTVSTAGSNGNGGGSGPPTAVVDVEHTNGSGNNNNGTDYANGVSSPQSSSSSPSKPSLVQMYDSKKKRREEEARAILRFNQKPSAGIAYAAQCGHIDADDPVDVALYMLHGGRADGQLDKTQIGEYLGREPEYQGGFSLRVLHAYVDQLSFEGMLFDEAIRYYLSGFRLPGEAQKIDRIMEKFAERYTLQNPTVFPTADAAFILAFSIIMLNTDLHNPAIKEERRMTKEGFIRNNRGICDGGDLPEELLTSIFDRIKTNPISLKEDDEARERVGDGKGDGALAPAAGVLSPSVFFGSHYVEMDRTRETNFQKERDQIVRNTESLLKRKKKHHNPGKASPAATGATAAKSSVKFVRTEDTGLRDEYVSPMFDVTWAPALAVFSTAMESANGTIGALTAIAGDEEMELASKNAAEAIEVCLNGFQLAICTAGLCGNDTARSAFVHALENFSLLGTGRLMEYRHVRCVQTLLRLGRDDGELLGSTWEHVFRALSEVARLRQLFEYMARNDRAAAAAAERRQRRMEAREAKIAAAEAARFAGASGETDDAEDASFASSMISSDSEDYLSDDESLLEDEMDKRAIDEANARSIHDAVPETLTDAIFHRSTALSVPSVTDFVFQLCRVSRMEISGYGGHVGSHSNTVDLTAVHYRQQHTLLTNRGTDAAGHYNQPDIYSLQKLVEVAHYNMDSRPRLVFADIWTTISAHLTSTALHSNFAVATYAVDSFRQLSTQFLQREELGVFEFQRKFLKPFETVMARCEHTSVKELLLNCIEQIILLFGAEPDSADDPRDKHRGTLRSGWRPVLTVLGLAGHDVDDGIAETGFKMLTDQLSQCISVENLNNGVAAAQKPSVLERSKSSSALVLRAERFVDLVDALLMYVSGQREEMSLLSIDHLVTLSNFLADDTIPLPLVRHSKSAPSTGQGNQELELWWPILLGLSRAVGDPRRNVRTKSLVTLFAIINQHFFPSPSGDAKSEESSSFVNPTVPAEKSSATDDGSAPPQHGDLQTLQLIFRGVLTPMLEHAEMRANSGNRSPPPLPDDFERFVTRTLQPPASKQKLKTGELEEKSSWLDTTFDHLMDGCVSICLKSIEIYQTDSLVEEVLGMFNSCLISDSGSLAVCGLHRLHKFISEDLEAESITDDTWATVCHMLRRCLTVRGLPSSSSTSSDSDAPEEKDGNQQQQQEAIAMMNEFVLEEELLADRRYIGGNAVMIIGSLLGNKAHVASMGLRWYVFLGTGLGRGIKDWEEAARIMAMYPPQSLITDEDSSPPHYLENALYGRKWLVSFLLHLIGKEDVLNPEKIATGSKPSATAAKNLVKEQSEALLSSLMERESTTPEGTGAISEACRATELKFMTGAVCELLDAFMKLDDNRLFGLAALTPTFSACIQSNNKAVRDKVHNLVQRMFDGPLSDRMKKEGGKSPVVVKHKTPEA